MSDESENTPTVSSEESSPPYAEITPSLDANENTETAAENNENNANMEPTPSENTETAPSENTETAPSENTETAPSENTETVEAVVPAKVKPIRSTSQKEYDNKAREIFIRMKDLYDTEFADVPVKNRPKAKYWVARAAVAKEEGPERNDYISKMMKSDRSALNSQSSNANNSSKGHAAAINHFHEKLDSAVESAMLSVQEAATTSFTRRAAKKFIGALHRAKQALNRATRKNSNNSTNMNSPYKSRMKASNSLVNGNSATSENSESMAPVPENSESMLPVPANSEPVNSEPVNSSKFSNVKNSLNLPMDKLTINTRKKRKRNNNNNNTLAKKAARMNLNNNSSGLEL
jgi:hypothetical protein